MFKTVTQYFNQSHLGNCTVKCLMELTQRIYGTQSFKTSPRHWLGSLDKVGKRDDIQCHAFVIWVTIASVISFLPAAFTGNKEFLYFTLKKFLGFISCTTKGIIIGFCPLSKPSVNHDYTTFRFPVTLS